MTSGSTIAVPHRDHDSYPWRRWIGLAAILITIGMVGYRPLMTATADKRVHKICAALTPGMSIANAEKFANTHGMYAPTRDAIGRFYIGEKATSNYYGCWLEFKDGALQSATYFDFVKRK